MAGHARWRPPDPGQNLLMRYGARSNSGALPATAAVSNLSFLQPVKVGDVVCVYTDIVRTGRSSITLGVEAWVLRRGQGQRVRVTAADFVLVAVDDAGRPRMVPTVGS